MKLLNSAMMPNLKGHYSVREIGLKEFCEHIQYETDRGTLESYIGYPQSCALIREWTGIQVELNRESVTLEDGDSMLIMRLKYRPDIKDKGTLVDPNDFEFAFVCYQEVPRGLTYEHSKP